MNFDVLRLSDQINSVCKKYHIQQLSLFGSMVRDDFRPDSDMDILVVFDSGHTPGFDFFLIEAELSRILGRQVDLQTINFLSPEIRKSVLSEVVPFYEQA